MSRSRESIEANDGSGENERRRAVLESMTVREVMPDGSFRDVDTSEGSVETIKIDPNEDLSGRSCSEMLRRISNGDFKENGVPSSSQKSSGGVTLPREQINGETPQDFKEMRASHSRSTSVSTDLTITPARAARTHLRATSKGAGTAPSASTLIRSGASENDEYFYTTPEQKVDVQTRLNGKSPDYSKLSFDAQVAVETAKEVQRHKEELKPQVDGLLKSHERAFQQQLAQKDAQIRYLRAKTVEQDSEIAKLKEEMADLSDTMNRVQGDIVNLEFSIRDDAPGPRRYDSNTPPMQPYMQVPNTFPPAHRPSQYFFGGADQMLPGFQPQPQFYPPPQLQSQLVFNPQMQHPPAFNAQPAYHAQQVSPPMAPGGMAVNTPTRLPRQADTTDGAVHHSPQTPTPMPVAQSLTPTTAYFNQKSTQELLHTTFAYAEAAVRAGTVAPFHKNLGSDQKARELFNACVRHLCNRKEVDILLDHNDDRFYLIAGVLNQFLVEDVFRKDILSEFPCNTTDVFIQAWNAEYDVIKSDMCGNLDYRQSLMQERIEAAQAITNSPGFWKWVQQYTERMTAFIAAKMAPAIPHRAFNNFKNALSRSVNEAVRLAIRLRQEPSSTEFHCQKIGISWNSRYMVHRNPELIGQELRDDKPEYNTRCSIAPLVKQRYFKVQNENPTVVHRGEVLVCHRSANLRMMRNHQYVHPMENFGQKRIDEPGTIQQYGTPGYHQYR